MSQLINDEKPFSPKYILSTRYLEPHPGKRHAETYTITPNNCGFLSMMYIKSERTPEKVELFIGNVLIGECFENDIISANNENQYQEFTNTESIRTNGLFMYSDAGKKLGKRDINFYKILLYKNTPNINMRPKDVITPSYFLPINDAKYQQIIVHVCYREKEEYSMWNSNLYTEYAYPMTTYYFPTNINEEKRLLKFDNGRIEKIE